MQNTRIQILSGYSDQNRILFAGETAGFLNPIGEGISAAAESGYCAAPAILSHKEDPQVVLSDYTDRIKLLENYMKRQWSLTGLLAATFQEMV